MNGTNFEKLMTIISAPMKLGQKLLGVELTPNLMHKAGLVKMLQSYGWTPSISLIESCDDMFYKKLGDEAEAAARRGEFVMTIGGDHSISTGSISGMLRARPELGVIWVDAHADLHTPTTSETGNLHGMPVGLLMADDSTRTQLPEFTWMKNGPRLTADRLVYIGVRDMDKAEIAKIHNEHILFFTMSDVTQLGIHEVMVRTLKYLFNLPLHLSFDIDAIDPQIAPHTGTPVPGGLTFSESVEIVKTIAQTNNLCSMDLVEINPTLGQTQDENNETLKIGMLLLESLFHLE